MQIIKLILIIIKMQMDVNSLNTLNIDVIPFFSITNLSTDTKFNTLTEYMESLIFYKRNHKQILKLNI